MTAFSPSSSCAIRGGRLRAYTLTKCAFLRWVRVAPPYAALRLRTEAMYKREWRPKVRVAPGGHFQTSQVKSHRQE